MTGWEDVALGDLGRVVTGRTPPAAFPEAFGDDYPFVTPTDMDERRYIDRTERKLSESGATTMPRQRVPAGAVMVSCIGWQLGKVAIAARESFTNQQLNTVVPNEAVVDPVFLYYHLTTRREEIKQLASGGTRTPILNKSRFEALRVCLPPRDIQAKIANTLGCIDDLIENDRRRVELLEEMAQAIYREWFVYFRYPGHHNATLVDSAVGRIPEAWVVSTCGDELRFIGGGTPSKKVPTFWEDGTVRWYTPSDLTKNRWRYTEEPDLRITDAGVSNSSARRFPAGSVLMTSRATLGVLAIASTEATTNQGFIVMLPDERWSPSFMREWLDAHAAELAAIGTGATFREITKGAFKRFPFVVPSQDVLDAYRSATDPLEKQIQNLEREIRILGRLRDLLLPMLVTGRIAVSSVDLDMLVEDSVV
jgi:type I restriction enzyme, S subunit